MNYRNEIIKKINELDESNERLSSLAKGHVEMLDTTKAPKQAYHEFYNDIKDLTSNVQQSLGKIAEDNNMTLEQHQGQERGGECNQLLK